MKLPPRHPLCDKELLSAAPASHAAGTRDTLEQWEDIKHLAKASEL